MITLVSWGAYTDQLVVDAAHVLPVPCSLDDLTAAAFPVSYATTHVSLLHRGGLRSGETVVIAGAIGNLGEAALPVVRAASARVIAVDRSGALREPVSTSVRGTDRRRSSQALSNVIPSSTMAGDGGPPSDRSVFRPGDRGSKVRGSIASTGAPVE